MHTLLNLPVIFEHPVVDILRATEKDLFNLGKMSMQVTNDIISQVR